MNRIRAIPHLPISTQTPTIRLIRCVYSAGCVVTRRNKGGIGKIDHLDWKTLVVYLAITQLPVGAAPPTSGLSEGVYHAAMN